ncbi:MAG TPA: hypothetical protein DCX32_01260 [Candidatus Moranbacteria bacterium]|nr:MAG: hypothetical protein UW95_C0008G0029 [Parcubacteria group bacterium GW2011_GWC1_45_14]HAV11157.1 hypothetical protein [Candidatus Moranbacteria bacterium]
MDKRFLKEKIKKNWKSGITVSFVSLPLSISLAVAAGATPLMGVITAVWAGLAASVLGGSNYNIVGPTGALSGILVVYALSYGVAILPFLAILSGLFILLVYILRFERYIIFIPSSVIHGFTLGVAFIIALGQLNFSLGITGIAQHERLIANIGETFLNLERTNLAALMLFAVSFVFLLVWRRFFVKIPGVIIVAPFGMLLGYLSQGGDIAINLQTLFSRFGDISGKLWALPQAGLFLNKDIFIGAMTIALVAILETLLSAKIADGMSKTKHNTRKEVLGVGVANIASGIFGGIPATAALARTALNIKSGADHKMSAAISSVSIVVISLVLLPFFKYLPLATVAAILVFTAVQMVEKKHFLHLYKHDKSALFLSLLVAAITVVEDPIAGILVGATIALLIFANNMSRADTEITLNKDKQLIKRINSAQLLKTKDHGDVLVYRFAGQLTYVNAQSHLNNIGRINGETKTVILSFRNLFFLDVDGINSINEMVSILEGKGKRVMLSAINGLVAKPLKKEGWFMRLHEKEMVFASTQEALEKC